MIKIETTFGKKEYEILTDVSLNLTVNKRKRLWFRVIFGIFGICSFALTLSYYRTSGLELVTILWFLIFLVMLYYAIFAKQWQRRRLMQFYRKNEKQATVNTKTREYVFDDEQVQVKTPVSETTYKWDAIQSCMRKENYMVLHLFNNTLIIIDENHISKDDKQALLQLLKSKNFTLN